MLRFSRPINGIPLSLGTNTFVVTYAQTFTITVVI
jgi:hypothetical protein